MKNLFKTTARILAAFALCASISACGQLGSVQGNSFPAYSAQSPAAGHFVAPTIMDEL